MFFAPFLVLYAILFLGLLTFVFVVVQIGIIHYAFGVLGLPPNLAFAARARPEAVAYASAVMGTLIGAALLNLRKRRDLGAPVASIGGAGTFDGVFLTGIVAVLLA